MPVETKVTQFVQDQQIRFSQCPFQLTQMVVVLGLTQLCGQCCCILKQDVISLGAGFQSQGNCQMCFAPSWVANHNDILPILYKLTAGQFLQE